MWQHYNWYQPHFELGLNLDMSYDISVVKLLKIFLQSENVMCVTGHNECIFVRILPTYNCFVQIFLHDLFKIVYRRTRYEYESIVQKLVRPLLENVPGFDVSKGLYEELKRFNGSLKRSTMDDQKLLLQEIKQFKMQIPHVKMKNQIDWPNKPIMVGQMGVHLCIPKIYNDDLLSHMSRQVITYIKKENNLDRCVMIVNQVW